MAEIYSSSLRDKMNSLAREHGNKDPNLVYSELAKLPGLEIIEERDTKTDQTNYRCAEYAFKVRMGLEWTKTDQNKFWIDSNEYLTRQRFTEVEDPQNGDLIAYAAHTIDEAYPIFDDQDFWTFERRREAKPPYIKHVGVWENGKVISKFNEGHVFKHKLDLVPTSFGNVVHFYRRNTQN